MRTSNETMKVSCRGEGWYSGVLLVIRVIKLIGAIYSLLILKGHSPNTSIFINCLKVIYIDYPIILVWNQGYRLKKRKQIN